MLGNGRKTIGVFIQQINEEYQNLLCRGISKRAKELDYNVAVFTNFGGSGQEIYDIGESNIVNLPNYEELDGIILAPDTMNVKGLEEQYNERIRSRSNCPVISIRSARKGFYNVLINDDIILDKIITHFIEEHKFTRINFLSGPKGFFEIEKRLQSYRRILTEHGLPVEEERIYYGDLWKREGNKAVEQWLDGPLPWPQAIVCANDFMAMTVCRALTKRGIRVPEDIAVSGCDDIEFSEEFIPSITTVRLPILEMGIEAVNKIHTYHMGGEQTENSYVQSPATTFRASCGCNKEWYLEVSERRLRKIASNDTLQNEIMRIAQMSIDLTGLGTLEDAFEGIEHYLFEQGSLSLFYICLRENWSFTDNLTEQDTNDNMIMQRGFKDNQTYEKVKFSSKELLPAGLEGDLPTTYYFALLHYQKHYFGYVVFSFKSEMTSMFTLQAWLNNVGSVLENVRMQLEVKRLLFQLEDMSIRDDLTGLYNRRVLDTLGKQILEQSQKENSRLMIFIADMDKLKTINDNLGHSRGDAALKALAGALKSAANDDEICIRLGGDEFMAIGMDYDENKMTEFTNRFVEELNRFNASDESEFDVYVSYGWNLIYPDAHTTIEDCMHIADYRMYQQKYNKVCNNIRANL